MLALGADISSGSPAFNANLDATEREERSSNLLQAFTAEASMMARCTGKTNVQNLEPEDLRAITLVVSHAAGVPMAISTSALSRLGFSAAAAHLLTRVRPLPARCAFP